MARYLAHRLLSGLLVLFGVVSLVFLIFNLKPGDPARMLADQRSSPEALAAIRQDLGLGLPLGVRYLLYLNDLSPVSVMQRANRTRPAYLDPERYSVAAALPIGGDKLLVLKAPYLRFSYQSRRGVAQILAEAFPNTAILAVLSMLLAVVLGLAMGTWAAVKKGTWVDSALLGISALGMAGPSFFVAVLVAWLGGFVWFERIPLPILPLVALLVWLIQRFGLPLLPSKLTGSTRRLPTRPSPTRPSPARPSPARPSPARPSPTRHSPTRRLPTRHLPLFLLTIYFLGLLFHWSWATASLSLPGTGLPMSGSLRDVDPFTGPFLNWKHAILPVFVLGIRPLAVIVQLTRSSLLDVLSQDHIRTARAKGLSERQVVLRHGLRNALMPVLTAVSGWFASLLAGAVFVEYVFGWKGMGLEVFNALEREDFPVVMGAVLVFATIFVVMNVVVDLLYAVLDPRVRTA
jgi:ABC-type dipeptide/oligopeptide/nickel transport system permease component